MIILNLDGGLGNQMSAYAYAKALAREYGEEIKVNIWWLKLNGVALNLKNILLGQKTEHHSYKLFCLECDKELKRLPFFRGIYHAVKYEIFLFIQIYFYKGKNLHGEEAYKKLSSKGFFYTQDYATFYNHGKCNKRNKYVQGVFSSAKYFSNIEDELKSSFRVSMPPSEENRKMLACIQNTNAVCLHIRRGDYINNSFYASLLNICTEQYYKKSVEYINSHTKNPVFFVFSNNSEELDWIKKNYHFDDKNFIYVDLNNCDYEELRLMMNCQHFIISNSTFSWWAANLSPYLNKFICVPSEWIKNYNMRLDVYDDNMIKIPINSNKTEDS